MPPYKLLIEKTNSKSGIETIKENSTLIINEGDELKLICKSIGGKNNSIQFIEFQLQFMRLNSQINK